MAKLPLISGQAMVKFLTNPEECHIITGDFDTMLKMHFRDARHINKTIEVLRKND